MHHHEHHHGLEHHHEHEREAPQPQGPRFNKREGVPQPPRLSQFSTFDDALVEEARMEVQDAVAEVLVTCSDLCQQQQQPRYFRGQAPQPAVQEDEIEWAQGFLKLTEPYDDITFEPKFLEPAAFTIRAREVVSDTGDAAFELPSRSEQLRCIIANQGSASDVCRGSLAHLQSASMQLRYAADGPYDDDAAAAAGVSCLFLVLLILFLPLAILKAHRRRAAMHKAHKSFRLLTATLT
jgi:hypothetical protein